MSAKFTLDSFKTAVSDAKLEDQFLKLTGLSSMSELSPENFNENFGKADSLTKALTAPSAAPVPHEERKKDAADSKPTPDSIVASDFLYGFKHFSIQYPPRRKVNTFIPSAYMMYYIVHEMNVLLCEHFYFKREAPNYHPLLLRIYFGIVFIVQGLRAQHAASALFGDQFEFLDKFLDAYPADTLPIPAPLLHIFKSLCSSRPEIPQLGFVAPIIDEFPGNDKMSDGPKNTGHYYLLPNIPYLLSYYALLADQKGKLSDIKKYLGDGTNDRTFAGITWDKDPTAWTANAYALVSSGMEHFIEGTTTFNEDFVKLRADNLEIPTPGVNDKTGTVDQFCFLKKKLSWFRDLLDIVDPLTKFFPGSGTLADCSPIGAPVCQIQANVTNVDFDKPTKLSQSKGFYAEAHTTLTSSSRTLDQLSMIMAAASQINVKIDHTNFHVKSRSQGPFWDLGPIETSSTDTAALLTVRQTVKKMMLSKTK
jgi:hypothetical protein